MPVLIIKGVGTAHVYVSYITYKIVTATVSEVRLMQHYCYTRQWNGTVQYCLEMLPLCHVSTVLLRRQPLEYLKFVQPFVFLFFGQDNSKGPGRL